jgi:NAD(P)-dependent dehydrogenase (short-subunit alcohol dehydrogenase family)
LEGEDAMAEQSKTILIRGSTDGVGRLVAKRLARPDFTILIHGRDRARGEKLAHTIRDSGGKASFYPADFSSLAEVRRLAESVRRDHPRLDLLINNAGIGLGPASLRLKSKDGYELRFAANYLAGFALTRLLLPVLEAGSSARIVNVASAGQQSIDFTDVMLTRGYSGRRAYCQSKLAQIMFTFDLATELAGSGITVNCLHPSSYMDTTMVRDDGLSPSSRVDEGADAILHLATSTEMEGRTGSYFDGLRRSRASAQAYDATDRERLHELSLKLVGRHQSDV